MNNKSTVLIVVAAIIIVVAAAGGYIIGKGSGNGSSSKSAYSGNGTSRPALSDNKASLISELEARLKEKPDDKEAIYGLADTYFSTKRFDEAVEYYKKLLTLTPEDTDVYNDLGLSLQIGRASCRERV